MSKIFRKFPVHSLLLLLLDFKFLIFSGTANFARCLFFCCLSLPLFVFSKCIDCGITLTVPESNIAYNQPGQPLIISTEVNGFLNIEIKYDSSTKGDCDSRFVGPPNLAISPEFNIPQDFHDIQPNIRLGIAVPGLQIYPNSKNLPNFSSAAALGGWNYVGYPSLPGTYFLIFTIMAPFRNNHNGNSDTCSRASELVIIKVYPQT